MINRQSKKYNRRTVALWKRPVFIVVALLVIVSGVTGALFMNGTLPPKKAQQPTDTTANSGTKGEPSLDAGTSPASQDGTWSSDNKDPENSNDAPTGEKPKTPEGNFVSNHHASLSGSSLQSSCVTTPGATCQIVFTKDGATKTLEAKKTDAGGGAYWTWTLEGAGLTAGTWKVQAKATLGDQSATADDGIPLEVSP